MGPQFQKLKRHLATEIAVAIRDGAYRSGEWLRQIDLEEKFNAKRFEVRAALAELTLRGTVAHVPNRGYCVAVPSIEQTRELLAIRALLEVEAAKLAMPNIGRRQLREIKLLADASRNRSSMVVWSNIPGLTLLSMTLFTSTRLTENWWNWSLRCATARSMADHALAFTQLARAKRNGPPRHYSCVGNER